LLVVSDERGALSRELFGRQATEGDQRAILQIVGACRLDERILVATIGAHELGVEADTQHVLDELPGLALSGSSEVDQIRSLGLDLRHERLEFLRLGIDALVAEDFKPDLLGASLEEIGDALAVDFAIVEDE